MKKVCPRCGKYLLTIDCICSCDTMYYHHTIFDDTMVIQTLLESIKDATSHVLVSQIGNIIVDEITLICNIKPLYVYHVDLEDVYDTFFNQLILYINSHLIRGEDTPLCVCVKGRKGLQSISLIE